MVNNGRITLTRFFILFLLQGFWGIGSYVPFSGSSEDSGIAKKERRRERNERSGFVSGGWRAVLFENVMPPAFARIDAAAISELEEPAVKVSDQKKNCAGFSGQDACKEKCFQNGGTMVRLSRDELGGFYQRCVNSSWCEDTSCNRTASAACVGCVTTGATKGCHAPTHYPPKFCPSYCCPKPR